MNAILALSFLCLASAVPVEPSYIEALATSMPVSNVTCVWNSKRYCKVPCVISGWYGV